MTLGLMAKDCEIRIDYDKLRKDRVRKTNEQMTKEGIATLLVFDQDWIRYITSTKVNDWANNKLLRSALMVAGEEPILYELGSAIAAKKKLCPWIADRMFPSIGTWRGAFPRAVGEENAKKFARMVKDHLTQYGVQNEPVSRPHCLIVSFVSFWHHIQYDYIIFNQRLFLIFLILPLKSRHHRLLHYS